MVDGESEAMQSEKFLPLQEAKKLDKTEHLSLSDFCNPLEPNPSTTGNSKLKLSKSVPNLLTSLSELSTDASLRKSYIFSLFCNELPDFDSKEAVYESSDEDEIDYELKISFLSDNEDEALDRVLFPKRNAVASKDLESCVTFKDESELERAAKELGVQQRREELAIYRKYYADGTLLKHRTKKERGAWLFGQRLIRKEAQTEHSLSKLLERQSFLKLKITELESRSDVAKRDAVSSASGGADLNAKIAEKLRADLRECEKLINGKERRLDVIKLHCRSFEEEQSQNDKEDAIVARLRVKMCIKQAISQVKAVKNRISKQEEQKKREILERQKQRHMANQDASLRAKIQEHIRKMREKTLAEASMKAEIERRRKERIKENQLSLQRTIESLHRS